LSRRGLVGSDGDPYWRYAGTPKDFAEAGYLPPPKFVPFEVWAVSAQDREAG
jgi:hypothetical protein